MSSRSIVRALQALALAILVTALGVAPSTAQVATPDGVTVQEPIEVVAAGLDNPRHLAVNRIGRIYVAEAGAGGPALVETPLGDSDGPVCVGDSGAVSVVVRGQGIARPVIDGLPSVAAAVDGACGGPGFGFGATGPQGLDVTTADPTYSLGLGGTPAPRDLLAAADAVAADLGTVASPFRPRFEAADIAALEAAIDVDGQGPDSNPYGLQRLPGGRTVVADAGANAVFELDPTGAASVLAVFAPRCVPWELPFPNPIPPAGNPCGDQALFPAQAVPTGVAEARNGDLLVSTLGGFPFTVGYSRIFRIPAGGERPAVCSTFAPVPASGCEVFADGLTALVDLAVAADGKVYAVQFADAGVLAGESGAPGSEAGSVRILHRRTGEEMGSIVGLTLPGGIAIDGRDVYVTNWSVAPGWGEVVRAKTLCTALDKAICQAG